MSELILNETVGIHQGNFKDKRENRNLCLTDYLFYPNANLRVLDFSLCSEGAGGRNSHIKVTGVTIIPFRH